MHTFRLLHSKHTGTKVEQVKLNDCQIWNGGAITQGFSARSPGPEGPICILTILRKSPLKIVFMFQTHCKVLLGER